MYAKDRLARISASPLIVAEFLQKGAQFFYDGGHMPFLASPFPYSALIDGFGNVFVGGRTDDFVARVLVKPQPLIVPGQPQEFEIPPRLQRQVGDDVLIAEFEPWAANRLAQSESGAHRPPIEVGRGVDFLTL